MERVFFPNQSGVTLHGLFWPHAGSRAVLMCPGFTGRSDSPNKRIWATALNEKFAVLSLDFAGHGRSGGKFEDTTITSEIIDLEAALGWLKAKGFKEFGLVGHSFGGVVTVAEAAKNKSVKAVCTVAAPFRHERYPDALMPAEKVAEWRKNRHVHFEGSGFAFDLKYAFKEDQRKYPMEKIVPQLKQPLLVIQGTKDELVDMKDAENYFGKKGVVPGKLDKPGFGSNADKAAKAKSATERKLFVVEGGDHGLMRQSEAVGKEMLGFFGRFL